MWWKIILIVFIGYILLFFVLSRLCIPFLGVKKDRLPSKIPKDMEKTISKFKKQSKNNKEKFLKLCYAYIVKNYRGSRTLIILYFPSLFWTNIDKIWNHKSFLHCTQLNHLLRVMLRKSSLFKPEDIKFPIGFVNFSIHQHLKVRVNGKWIDADPWGGIVKGIKIGEHSSLVE